MQKNYKRNVLQKSIEIQGIYTIFKNRMLPFFSSIIETHDFWELIYVEKGNVYVEVEEQTLELCEGELFIHAPNNCHRHYVLNKKAMLSIMSFDGSLDLLFSMSNHVISASQIMKASIGQIMRLSKNVFEKISEEFEFQCYEDRHAFGEQFLINQMETLLLIILSQEGEKGLEEHLYQRAEGVESRLSDHIIQYLAIHIQRQVTIEQLCQQFYMSKSTISQRFKDEVGMGIIEYFNYMKIQKAKEMLLRTEKSMMEIALAFGYSSNQYFTRVFRRFEKISPSLYRKKNKKRGVAIIESRA